MNEKNQSDGCNWSIDAINKTISEALQESIDRLTNEIFLDTDKPCKTDRIVISQGDGMYSVGSKCPMTGLALYIKQNKNYWLANHSLR